MNKTVKQSRICLLQQFVASNGSHLPLALRSTWTLTSYQAGYRKLWEDGELFSCVSGPCDARNQKGTSQRHEDYALPADRL